MKEKRNFSKTEKRRVEVVSYNSNWKGMYKEESEKIKNILSDIIIDIHHIGSTAIPEIKAKPVIDILVEVKDIETVDRYNNKIEEFGYEVMGEYGIPKRRFFKKGGNKRTHHIHIFQTGNEEIERHINFKEYLIAHPDKGREYSKLKEELINKYSYDIESYTQGKNDFIKEIDKKAKLWEK
ncbi:MAG: GrpB family protein [Atribacterota bacterium]